LGRQLDKCYRPLASEACTGVAGAVDIGEELIKSHPPTEVLMANDPNSGLHLYFISKWIDNDHVLLEVSGDYQAVGFHRFTCTYVYHVGDRSFSLIKPPHEMPE
jgi:hypothetical protein